MTTNTGATLVMTDALTATRPGALLLQAATATAPKSRRKALRAKLDREEVHAVMRVVTEQVRRFGLKPTVALLPPGAPTEAAGGTYKLFLTEDEMASGAFTRPDNSIVRRVGTHVESVRRIARHAGAAGHQVDIIDLLDEMAVPLCEFLAQFAPEAVDPDVELAGDIALLARWLGSPRRDFDLPRFMSDASRQSLRFNPITGVMEPDLQGDPSGRNTPTLPLFLRVAARIPVEVHDAVVVSAPGTKAIGKAICFLCYEVGLTAVSDGDGLRAAFTLDPVHFVTPTQQNRAETPRSPPGPYSRFRGFLPWKGEIHIGGTRYVETEEFEVLCPLFDRHLKAVHGTCPGYRPRTWHERRLEEVTPETVAVIFGELKTCWPRRNLLISGECVEETILPWYVESERGIESGRLRDRFEAVLYLPDTDPKSVAARMAEEARRRCAALDEHEFAEADWNRKRKLAFRSSMKC